MIVIDLSPTHSSYTAAAVRSQNRLVVLPYGSEVFLPLLVGELVTNIKVGGGKS